MRPRKKTVEAAQVEASFNCPFCIITKPGSLTSVCRDPKGRAFVLHPLPECPQFRDMDADEYLRKVREKLGTRWTLGNEDKNAAGLYEILERGSALKHRKLS